MKKIIISLVLALMLVGLTGCSRKVDIKDYAVNSEIFGTITDKFFVPHIDSVKTEFIDGKNRTVEIHEPDMWYFRIQREEEKDILQTDVRVTEEVWNQYEVGDFYGGE